MSFSFVLNEAVKENPEPLKNIIELVDFVATQLRLKPDAKARAAKARLTAEETLSKLTHADRQEAAQQRRIERARKDKEAFETMSPDAQRKAEEREHRRSLKKKTRVKMM